MEFEFDLLTIGAGSGGVAASRRASALGAKVALVESGRVGGTCVLRGCVPKKLLMMAAQYGDTSQEADGYGWGTCSRSFEMSRWAAAKAAELARLEAVYRQLLLGSKVELIAGRAVVEAPNTVRVGERVITAKHILIATGSSPIRDSIEGIDACATSDELLDLTELPASMAVIGAGYIGVEFASILARFGVKVSLFYRDRLPLRGFDDDLRTRLAASLQAAGIDLHPGSPPRSIQRAGDDFLLVTADERIRSFPFVLNATGRRPNTQGLGLESLGIHLGPGGQIPVDSRMRTTAPNVYAVGDVTDRVNLTPVAIAEGRALVESLFGPTPREVDLHLIATAVFTLPPLGTIGPTEEKALAAGHRLKVFESDFRPMRLAFIGRPDRVYIKLLVDADTDKVLAAHMLGADAPEIVQSLAIALTCGATKEQFDRTLAVHPTSAEEIVLMREPTRRVPPPSTPA